jgi:deoxyribodipyrimidine photo-lyase
MPNPAADAPVIVWFRDDLRLADQPALDAARRSKRPVICLYVYDAGRSSGRELGAASKWWLHHSLAALGASIEKIGARLDVIAGDHEDLPKFAQSLGAGAVYWTRRYGGAQIACDAQVKKDLGAAGVEPASFNGHLLREPWEVTTKTGGPMKVFTPFWRASQALGDIRRPCPPPRR